jgi:TonB family protein
MTDRDKDLRSLDRSARLDALLSDFLSKEIVVSSDVLELPETESVEPIASVQETTSSPSPIHQSPTVPAKPSEKPRVVPVDRTECWEQTNPSVPKPVSGPRPSGTTPGGQFQPSNVVSLDHLEKSLDSALTPPKADPGKHKLIMSAAGLFLIVLGTGFYFWSGSKQGASSQDQTAATIPSVSDSATEQVSDGSVGYPASSAEVERGTPVGGVPTSTNGDAPAPRARSSDAHQDSMASAAEKPADRSADLPQKMLPATRRAETDPARQAISDAAVPSSLQDIPAPAAVDPNLPQSATQGQQIVKSAPPPVPLPVPHLQPRNRAVTTPDSASIEPFGGSVTAAMALVKVEPSYPELARRMNVSGTVEVSITVDQLGKVAEAKAVSGPPLLRGAAEMALQKWRFRPAIVNGKPVIGTGKVSVIFHKPQR